MRQLKVPVQLIKALVDFNLLFEAIFYATKANHLDYFDKDIFQSSI